MDAPDYVIQYPLDAVHPDKFAELLGKPRTAVQTMIEKISCRLLSFVISQSQVLPTVQNWFCRINDNKFANSGLPIF